MLQVEISATGRYSMAEQAQMAVEAGARWLTVDWRGVSDADIRALGADIVAVCREQGVILVFEDHDHDAREMGVHGVLAATAAEALRLREQWGAEPILGAYVTDAAQAEELARGDVDYGVLDARQLVSIPAPLNTAFPVVCRGDFDPDCCRNIIRAGFAGVMTGKHLFDCDDPAERISQLLQSL